MLEDDDIETSPEQDEELPDEAAGEDEDSSSRGGGKRLPEKTWLEIELAWEQSTATMTELSQRYGVSRQSISKRFQRRKIRGGSRAHEVKNALAAKTAAAVAAVPPEPTFADKRSGWVEDTRVSGYNDLKNLRSVARVKIAQAIKGGHSLVTIDPELKALERYGKIQINSINAQLRLLNADAVIDEASLPELNLNNLTDEMIAEIQNGDKNGDEEEEILTEEDLADVVLRA